MRKPPKERKLRENIDTQCGLYVCELWEVEGDFVVVLDSRTKEWVQSYKTQEEAVRDFDRWSEDYLE